MRKSNSMSTNESLNFIRIQIKVQHNAEGRIQKVPIMPEGRFRTGMNIQTIITMYRLMHSMFDASFPWAFPSLGLGLGLGSMSMISKHLE